MPAALGIAGYWGKVFSIRLPAITPEETFKLAGALGLTTVGRPAPSLSIREPIPSGIPLLRSLMSVRLTIDGGVAGSFTCFIAFGILLGACNSVLSDSDLV